MIKHIQVLEHLRKNEYKMQLEQKHIKRAEAPFAHQPVDYHIFVIPSDAAHHPFTPPDASPLTRFFSMIMNKITTGTMANRDAANRYCHSIML